MNDFGSPVALFGPLDYWRLCDELSVVQAALLIVGKIHQEFRILSIIQTCRIDQRGTMPPRLL
jgi:hypothetical protein